MRIGMGQILVETGRKKENVERLFEAVDQGGREGCDVVVLPECPLTGWLSASAKAGAETIPGPFTRELGKRARRRRMAVVSGVEEKAGTRLYNSAVFIGRDGELLARYRKINELEIGLRVYTRGDSLQVVEFDGRRIGIDICADSWTSEITDALHLMGARLILSPSAWAIAPGREERNIRWIGARYRALTRRRNVTLVGVNGVGTLAEGPWKGRVLQGDSLVFGPGGKKLLQGPRNEPAFLTFDYRPMKNASIGG